MDYLVNSKEMKACDNYIIDKIGMPSSVLMERAALAVVEEVLNPGKVLVVCGKGNNGGDGFAIGRLLYLKGLDVDILYIDDEASASPETIKQIKIAKNYGVNILNKADFSKYNTIIDALLGIRLSGQVKGDYRDLIDEINKSKAYLISVDIPSGISADNGKILGRAVKADKTVTFGFKKLGLILYPGAHYAGLVKVKDIGITEIGFAGNLPKTYSYSKEDLSLVPPRQAYSNKGTFGKALVIGGSKNMSGAAYLSAKAAYRMGAGLVNIYSVEENREILQTQLPEAILTTYNSDRIDKDELISKLKEASVIICGPGMGISKSTKEILQIVLSHGKSPIILDADALNIISQDPKVLENHKKEIILTPHLGEMARLTNKDIKDIRENIVEEAESLARKYKLVCVLKDTRTIVADGKQVYINQSGNNSMATGGSGDVLTGMIGGLICQGLNYKKAASLGVYIHGLAGDRTSEKLGPYGVMADDIIACINHIVR